MCKEIKYIVTNSGCWYCYSHGDRKRSVYYPMAVINGKRDSIARHYYRRYKGDIPDGLLIRHTCDNTHCINPDHLLLGTDADNARDKMERGRHRPRGPGKGKYPDKQFIDPLVRLAMKVSKLNREKSYETCYNLLG